jgi:hypothetical protein
MSKVLLAAAALLLLDVFPGGGCGCAPSTIAGPCQSTCDCDQNRAAPVRCPGRWECNASKRCEYTCHDICQDDGGCATAGQACNGSICAAPLTCP